MGVTQSSGIFLRPHRPLSPEYLHTASVRLNDLWLLKKEFPSYGSSTYCTKIEGSTKQSLKTKQGFVVTKIFRGNYKSTHIGPVITNDPCELTKNSVNDNKPNLS